MNQKKREQKMHQLTKRQKLEIACAAAGTNISGFARRLGVTHVAIINTLNGAKSQRLNNAIDRFISAQFEKLRLSSGRVAA
jgi:hypothetical protein